MAEQIELSEEDIASLLTVLRNSGRPVSTQQLIEALRSHAQRA